MFTGIKDVLSDEVCHLDLDLNDKLELSRVVSCVGKVLQAEETAGTKSEDGSKVVKDLAPASWSTVQRAVIKRESAFSFPN